MFEKTMAIALTAVNEPRTFFSNLSKKIAPFVLIGLLAMLITIVAMRGMTNPENSLALTASASYEEPVEDIPEPVVVEDPYEKDAIDIAKVLYGTAQYNSDEGKKLVVWCIMNRVESDKYPNTIHEVCAQKDQWMGYSDDNPVVKDLYDIAYETLKEFKEGPYRPIGPDYVFLSWSSDEIVLRTEFTETKSTHYWYEK